MKKDGIWIDEEGSGQIVDTFTLPCLSPAPKPRFEPGELAVRVGTTDVYQVIGCEADLSKRRRQGVGGNEREEISYLAEKVRVLEPRSLGLVPCEVGTVTRLADRDLQPLPPRSRLLEPGQRLTNRRPRVDLVGPSTRVRSLPSTAATRPALPRQTIGALGTPMGLIERKTLL